MKRITDNPAAAGNQVVIEGRRITEGRRQYWLSGTPIFSPEQIRQLIDLVEAENEPAQVESASDSYVRADARSTRVRWLNPAEHRWVYEIIWREASQANQLFDFEIVPMCDPIQLAIYDAEEEGFFRWHTDTIPADLTRKISITCPLNDSSEYEGGDLEFNGGAIERPAQRAGSPVMFPSWLLHRVTPVTRGKRYSLVAWIRGPNWR